MTVSVSLDDITDARRRIAQGVCLTPCPESAALSELVGCRIFCKLDHLQRTGSFKERGARNALLLLTPADRQRGVIAASAGNHALALAYHGRSLDMPVSVVMPRHAPLVKVGACQRLGARVVMHGDDFASAQTRALELAAAQRLTYIHGYDDPAIIAGQGTLGLEILEQVPDVEAVIVPVGGGGLIAGVAVAIKATRPNVRVIGVEASAMPSFTAARRAGQPVDVPARATLADGLAVGRVGVRAFATAHPLVDQVVTVSDEQLAVAIMRMLELEKSVVEGAGAAPLAALLSGKLSDLTGRNVALLVCGGNIDPLIIGRVIEHAMVGDGRLVRLTATISDRPGGLARFASAIAQGGASIKEITHDRAFGGANVSSVRVVCVLETRDPAHVRELLDQLRQSGYVCHLHPGSKPMAPSSEFPLRPSRDAVAPDTDASPS